MRKKLIIGLVFTCLLAIDVTVCARIGIHIKEKREEQAKIEAHQRELQYKLGCWALFCKVMGEGQQELAKQEQQEQLQKDLKQDAENHKNDKPVQATAKPQTEQEKKDANLG